MVNKKIVIIVSIIAILIIGVLLGIKIYLLNRREQAQETNLSSEQKNTNNTISNFNSLNENIVEEKQENKVEEDENNISNTTTNETYNNTSSQDSNNLNETTKKTNKEESTNSSEEKAIELAKEKWGNKNTNVYYYIEDEVEDGVFLVSVRDSDTTAELTLYKVYIDSKKVVIEN